MRSFCFGLLLLTSLFATPPASAQQYDTEPVYGSRKEPFYGIESTATDSPSATPGEELESKIKATAKPIVVYGRQTCGWTQKYIQDLQKAGIPYVFKDVDDPTFFDEARRGLQESGSKSGSLSLPILDINGKMSSRPDLTSLIAATAKKANNP